MPLIGAVEYPADRHYDIDNQVWYAPAEGGLVRAGFTPIAMALAGDVLVFTPKRIGHAVEKGRWFAMIECGKWVGAARAAFDGRMAGANEALEARPALLNADAFGAGWMALIAPADAGWREDLLSGETIAPGFDAWLASEAYRDRDG